MRAGLSRGRPFPAAGVEGQRSEGKVVLTGRLASGVARYQPASTDEAISRTESYICLRSSSVRQYGGIR